MKKIIFSAFMLLSINGYAQPLVIQELPLEEPVAPSVSKSLPSQTTYSADSGEKGTLDELYTRLDAQEQTLSDVTERFEMIQHQLKLLEEKVMRMNQDIDFRLNEVETKPVSQSQAPVIIDKKSDKERYDYAYNLLKKNDYKQAEEQFQSFLKDFPKSDLVPNALYWLGETYYVQGIYDRAVGQFADVFTKYAQSNKAPDALLKMGLSMLSLGKQTEACTAFVALPNEYPKADATLKQRAQQEAKKNKCS